MGMRIQNLQVVKQTLLLPILSTLKENDWVLDPFSGSGTVGEVSILLGRKFVGYDTNEKFIQLQLERLKNLHECIWLRKSILE